MGQEADDHGAGHEVAAELVLSTEGQIGDLAGNQGCRQAVKHPPVDGKLFNQPGDTKSDAEVGRSAQENQRLSGNPRFVQAIDEHQRHNCRRKRHALPQRYARAAVEVRHHAGDRAETGAERTGHWRKAADIPGGGPIADPDD